MTDNTMSDATRVAKVRVKLGGEQRIEALRKIVADRQYGKVDNMKVDLFSASAIVKVYDALNPTNQAHFRSLPVMKMATIAFKLIK